MTTTNHPRDLVGNARIRVFSLADPNLVLDEGDVIAYDDGPSLILRHADGTQGSWSVRLRREIVGPFGAEPVVPTPAEPHGVGWRLARDEELLSRAEDTPLRKLVRDHLERERAAYERGKAERDERHERDVLEVIADRDLYHEWADKLADAIGAHLGIDIGEHSNMNNPWAVAYDALTAGGSDAA